MRLWIFTGSVPEDGDYCMVWAKDEAEAMKAGRLANGYEDAEYDDESEFSVDVATAEEVLDFADSVLRRQAGYPNPPPPEFRTEAIRDVMAERLRSVAKYDAAHDAARVDDLARAVVYFADPDALSKPMTPMWLVDEYEKQRCEGQTRRQALVRAAAFALAEIDRIDAGGDF